jgi:hypothetical protein
MKAKSIIHSILEENAVNAKKFISEDLVLKLGQRLAEEYVRVAKETFNEANEPRWQDSDGDGKWYEEGEDVNVEEGDEEGEEAEDEEECGEDKEEKE